MSQNNTAPALLLACAGFLYYYFLHPLLLYHFDLGWHLAAGDLIRATGEIPKHDPWSFTAGTHPWINFSWAWDIGASWLKEQFGFHGLIYLTALMGAAILGLQAHLALRMGARPAVLLPVFLLGGLALPQFTPPDVFLAATPQVVSLLLLPAFHYCLWLWRYEGTHRALYLLPLLLLPWANMHGGFLLGFLVLGIYAVEALHNSYLSRHPATSGASAQDPGSCAPALANASGRPQDDLRRITVALLACLAAACLTPWGPKSFVYVVQFLNSPVQQVITEWQPFWERAIGGPDRLHLLYLILFPLALKGSLRKQHPYLPIAAVSLLLAVMGIFQIRYLSLFIVVSLPFIAWGISQLLPDSPRTAPRLPRYAAWIAVPLSLLLAFSGTPATKPELPDATWHRKEITFLAIHYPHRRTLAHWNDGSFTIYQTRGRVPLFVDGRAATAYPDALLRDYMALSDIHEWKWPEILEKYGIEVVFWPKLAFVTQTYFLTHPEWEEVYETEYSRIFVRKVDN